MKVIKKADILLGIFFIIVGLTGSILIGTNYDKGGKAFVYLEGELYGTYNLNYDREIIIKKDDFTNTLKIKDGKIGMAHSNCKTQECVKMGYINRQYENIVCLPHKVLVKIEESSKEKEDSQIDVIAD